MDKLPPQRLDVIRQSDISLNFYRTESSPPGSIGPNPHRHTFNEFFFISSGSGAHIVDFVEYPIQPYTLYAVGRGQVSSLRMRHSCNYSMKSMTPGMNNFIKNRKLIAGLVKGIQAMTTQFPGELKCING